MKKKIAFLQAIIAIGIFVMYNGCYLVPVHV